MTPARKEKCSIRHGYDAMNRIEEAGLLIGALLKDQPGTGRDAYHLAYMDLQMETVEIAHQMPARAFSDARARLRVHCRARPASHRQAGGISCARSHPWPITRDNRDWRARAGPAPAAADRRNRAGTSPVSGH